MSNEAIKALEYYFRHESNTVRYFGTENGVHLFADFLQNGVTIAGDAPDAVILKDNTAIIIEHFEFDSSYVNRKGSSSRMERARIDRKQREWFAITENGVFHDKIRAAYSYQDYIENVTRNFSEHYLRIDSYKTNLLAKNIISSKTAIKTMFLIEDVSPIGSIALDNNSDTPCATPVVLAQSPEFLNLVAESDALDYVLCCSYACDSEYVWFIDRNDISAYREQQCDYAKMKFIGNYPSVVIGKLTLPN